MKCPKCNAELREGAKFCTKCGEKIVQQSEQKAEQQPVCAKCGTPLKPGAKFCTKCGTKVAAAAPAPVQEPKAPQAAQDMQAAAGRIYWNIQPGLVARVISEAEFDTYRKVQGVIIPEGTTAYIRCNGRTIASISGGTYDFQEEHAGNVLTHTAEAAGNALSRGWQFITSLFRRKNPEPKAEPTAQELYDQQQKLILENARRGAAFSVIILLDKAFPILIGAKQPSLDDYALFKPMKIQTAHLELEVGVNAYFRITHPEQFILHYLTDKTLLNTAAIVDEITDSVRVVLQEALYQTDLPDGRVSPELHALLKERINNVAEQAFFGLSVVRIVEVSASNEDLNRFTTLSRELYLSEQELDYLRRTNDFKNRLADVNNAQQLHEATTDLELRRQLHAINRNSRQEDLINEDELAKFELLLRNERILREARSDEEREAALHEIRKSGLIREEELQVMKENIQVNAYKRGVALAMMQLKDSIEFERTRLEGESEKAELVVRKELQLQQLKDEYADSRFDRELDQQRRVADAQLDVEQRRRDMDYNDTKRLHDLQREDDDAQFQQFLAMQNAEEQQRENQRRHEAEMQRQQLQNAQEIERLKWEGARDLSDEKVWAMQGGEAAVAYAQSKYSAENERRTRELLEAQRREQEARLDHERQRREEADRANQDRMYEMMNNMMNMTGAIAGVRNQEREQRNQERLADRDRELREREARLQRQEGRMDTAYDRALDYTTHNNVQPPVQPQGYVQQPAPQGSQQSATPVPQPAASAAPAAKELPAVCPECGAAVEPGALFCEDCGAKLS